MQESRTTGGPVNPMILREVGRRIGKLANRIDHELLGLVNATAGLSLLAQELEQIAREISRRAERPGADRSMTDQREPIPRRRSKK